MTRRRNLMLRLGHRLPNLSATVGAFIGDVDLRHAPTWCDVLDVHRKALTAWTDHEGWFGFGVVMVDIGWHVGSPVLPDPKTSVRFRCCHNYDVLRTQGERPRIPSACDNSARPDPATVISTIASV